MRLTSIGAKGALIILLPLVCQAVFVIVLATMLQNAYIEIDRQVHNKQLITKLDEFQRLFGCSWAAAYIYSSLKLPEYKEQHAIVERQLVDSFKELKNMPGSEPWEQQELTQNVMPNLKNALLAQHFLLKSDLLEVMRLRRAEGTYHEVAPRVLRVMDWPVRTYLQIANAQGQKGRIERAQKSHEIVLGLTSGVLISVLLSSMLGLFFTRNILQRLRNVVQNTFNLRRGAQLNPPISGRDELADMDRVLFDSAKRMQELHQFRTDLIGIVSHDVRTPLTAVSGSLSLLSHGVFGNLTEEGKAEADKSVENTDRLMRLVNNLLVIEKVQSDVYLTDQSETKTTFEQALKELEADLPGAQMSAPVPTIALTDSQDSRPALSTFHKGLVLIAVPALFAICFSSILFISLVSAKNSIEQQFQSYEIIAAAGSICAAVVDSNLCTVAAAAYHAPTMQQRITDDWSEISQCMAKLKPILTADPKKANSFEEARKFLYDLKEWQQHVTALQDADPTEVMKAAAERTTMNSEYFRSWKDTPRPITALLKQEQIYPLKPVHEELERTLILGLAIDAWLTISLALYFYTSLLRRIKNVTSNARRLTDRTELQKPIGGGDEFAYLDKLFYDTANQLHQLEQQKQEMVKLIRVRLEDPLINIRESLNHFQAGEFGTLNDKGSKTVFMARRALDRLVRLINDFLDLEKMEAGKLDLSCSAVSANELLEQCISTVEPLAQKKKLQMKLDAPELSLDVDADRIAQVVVNLLSNAVKYSPEGGTIWARANETEHGIELSIIDEGPGIPEDMTARIFDRFQQVSKADMTEKGGFGLGLYIARLLVELHGGTISARANPTKGSTFTINLPKVRLNAGKMPALREAAH